MNDNILFMPNGAIIILDDALVKTFLLRAGHFDDLAPQRPLDMISSSFEVPGAYCWAKHDYDHPRPEDNGYTLMLCPKETFTAAQAAMEFAEADRDCSLFPELAPVPIPEPQPMRN